MTKRRLGELLQAEGLVTEEQVRMGLEEQRKNNLFLGEALVKLGYVSEEAIAQTIIQQFSLPFMSAHQYNISIDVLNLFPERMYFEYQFVAVDKIGKTLIIIGAGLMNHDVLDELERLSGCKVCQFVSTWKDIRATLDKHQKDLKKDQLSLSSLGSMLLDGDGPAPTPATPAKLPPLPATAGKSGLSAAVAMAPKPNLSPVTKSVIMPASAVKTAATSGLNPAILAAGAKAATASGPRTAVPSSGAAPAVAPSAVTPRLSALSGVRPAVTGAPNKPAAPAPGAPAANNAEAAPAKEGSSSDSGRNPAQPGNKTGLLGLFKKQP